MLRKFTKAVGRYKAGESHDYPRDVWNRLAREVGSDLDVFTQSVEVGALLQNPLKRRPIIHKRLGATQ